MARPVRPHSSHSSHPYHLTFHSITVLHKLRHPPSHSPSSFTLDVLILSERHRRPAARCIEDIVLYDYIQEKKAVMPDFISSMFEKTWDMQEKAREECGGKVRRIVKRVEGLEGETWNRVGAVEDLGGAGK